MCKEIKLISTSTYFGALQTMCEELKKLPNFLDGKKIVFAEEKTSLMAERLICATLKGSFNTDVYSFSKFLRKRVLQKNALSKEGSSMVVKRILGEIDLGCFSASAKNLAPSLYELIIQLKSARVTPENVFAAADSTSGGLKNKLNDIAKVFDAYEKYIVANGFTDQGSFLSLLPDVILNSEEIKQADVFIVGYIGWTKQAEEIVSALIKSAKSVTAILTEGEKGLAYVNETANSFRRLCDNLNIKPEEPKIDEKLSKERTAILSGMFSPYTFKDSTKKTGKAFYFEAQNIYEEALFVAETIKKAVLEENCRYRDFTVAFSSSAEYGEALKQAFSDCGVPYYLDEKRSIENHPMVRLIVDYADAYRKNLERDSLVKFFKNPLFSEDKTFNDKFERYIIESNINYGRIKKPFNNIVLTDTDSQNKIDDFEEFRKKIVECFNSFSPRRLLKSLNAEKTLGGITDALKKIGEENESALNEQVFDKVMSIFDEMDMIFKGIELSATEFKNIFLSGVRAAEMSIIPQCSDAVFAGDYKSASLGEAKRLFVMGLNNSVPEIQSDVALLADRDLDALEQIKIKIDPKISVVNHRNREYVTQCVAAFTERLYLSYSITTSTGKQNIKGDVIRYLERLVNIEKVSKPEEYIFGAQAKKLFATECGRFFDGLINDFKKASAYYYAVKEKENLETFINKEGYQTAKIITPTREITKVSPTDIESFYECPYKHFASKILELKDSDEGVVRSLDSGIILHNVFQQYVANLDKVKDISSSDKLVERVFDDVIKNPSYARFKESADTDEAINRLKKEAHTACYKIYEQVENSKFKPKYVEAKIGEGDIPAIKICGGKVSIGGKIDRVDTYDNYFRIIDYKTGSSNDSLTEMFTGRNIQLYLYAATLAKSGKSTAGLYYFPINEGYVPDSDKSTAYLDGKTLDDDTVIVAQDKNAERNEKDKLTSKAISLKAGRVLNEEMLNACLKYSVAVCEKGAEKIREGVMVASPYNNECDYCDYAAMCGFDKELVKERTCPTIHIKFVKESVDKLGEKKDGN